MNKIKKILKLKQSLLLAVSIILFGFLFINTRINFANFINDSKIQKTKVYSNNQDSQINYSQHEDYRDESSSNDNKKGDAEVQLSVNTKSAVQNEIRSNTKKEYIYYPLLAANDPFYSTNWILEKTNTPSAWDISTGNGQTVIAIIDTGFALDHEDLKNNWLINSNESGYTSLTDNCWTGIAQDKSSNNCDDDNNGYIDDWRGWNFYLGDNNPMAGRTNPDGAGVSHGTETAGLAGATGNNNRGIATVNWNTKLMPLQVLSDDGPGFTSDVAAAVYYAVDNGADVINMSLGGVEYDETLETATNYAFENNVIVIAAAGNCGVSCDGAPVGSMAYPALNKNVISVGAITSSNQRADFSSYGPELDIVAPGSGSIVSTTWSKFNETSLYSTSLYGTSFASPQVASLASLIKSIRPAASSRDMTALILANGMKLSSMNGNIYTNSLGHGLIDAKLSLETAASLNNNESPPDLLQTGNYISEHMYSDNQTINTGCENPINSYCSVVLENEDNMLIRYLPYQRIGVSEITNWSWNSAILGTGSWRLRAIQGNYISRSYQLSKK